MFNPNTKSLIVESAIGMPGGCRIEFNIRGYKLVTDEEGDQCIEFVFEEPRDYVWFLQVSGTGNTVYCGYKAHKPCSPEFLSLVEKCALLALNGDREEVDELINEYRVNNPIYFVK